MTGSQIAAAGNTHQQLLAILDRYKLKIDGWSGGAGQYRDLYIGIGADHRVLSRAAHDIRTLLGSASASFSSVTNPDHPDHNKVMVEISSYWWPSPKGEFEMKSVLQDWVMRLGLRHQGVLLTAVRGCDTAPKNDPSKLFTRCLRAAILNCHCGDPAKAVSFIEAVDNQTLMDRAYALRKNCDHYPHHYMMHLIHACEVIAYKHPEVKVREFWRAIYTMFAASLHMKPETESEMDERLNADEETFGRKDKE